jgi:hypothetical protein
MEAPLPVFKTGNRTGNTPWKTTGSETVNKTGNGCQGTFFSS